jgi:peptidoglycan hydrolase-like protein with peptidoglycan-binding domain
MGRATRTAIMEFQRKENLAVTGRADRQTLEALGV